MQYIHSLEETGLLSKIYSGRLNRGGAVRLGGALCAAGILFFLRVFSGLRALRAFCIIIV